LAVAVSASRRFFLATPPPRVQPSVLLFVVEML
jgi:hypothetical protein